MNQYQIWCNLADSHRDLEFAQAVAGYMGFLKREGLIADWRLTRRKLGFGPAELGEFNVTITVIDLAQLERAFGAVAVRSGEMEQLHARVYSLVTDFRSALYRDFPAPQRQPAPPAPG